MFISGIETLSSTEVGHFLPPLNPISVKMKSKIVRTIPVLMLVSILIGTASQLAFATDSALTTVPGQAAPQSATIFVIFIPRVVMFVMQKRLGKEQFPGGPLP